MKADFENLIRRVRKGDADAAAELVREFESAVRAAVRARLFDPELRRQFDSVDICQSVLASFFVRMAAGQFALERPSQLVALLTKMAQNKLAWHVRHNRQQRRDMRRTEANTDDVLELTSGEADPARQVQAKDLLERTWQTMDVELREIASRRLEGQSWAQIAAGMGGTVGARKKQFARGIDEIARQLGIDEAGQYELQ
jgi:RNA polymerase sigma-70 factor (ECF subfamily)